MEQNGKIISSGQETNKSFFTSYSPILCLVVCLLTDPIFWVTGREDRAPFHILVAGQRLTRAGEIMQGGIREGGQNGRVTM